MSPEQGSGKTLDHRSDIFAIGAVFYELLSYRPAFSGESAMVVFYNVANATPAALEGLCPGLDSAVIGIVDKSLRKHPADRYQDLDTMRADIARVRQRIHSALLPADTSAHTQTNPVSPESLPQQRASQIDRHFQAAAAAFQEDDFERAIEWCRQVLIFDTSNAAALALIDRARAARDQQVVDDHVKRARQFVADGALTAAEDALAEALKRRAGDRSAKALQQELQAARHEEERARHRANAADAAIARARAGIDAGAFEAAARAASEAIAYAPDSADARTVLARALEMLERQRQSAPSRRPTQPSIHVTPAERAAASQVAIDLPDRPASQQQPDGSSRPQAAGRWMLLASLAAVVVLMAAAAGVMILRRDALPTATPALIEQTPPPAAVQPAAAPVTEPAAQPAAAQTPVTSPPAAAPSPTPPPAPARSATAAPPARTTAARTKSSEPSQAAIDLARRADQALEARDYDSAIRLYQSAVDASPDSPDLVARLNKAIAAKTRAENVAKEILGSRAPGLADDERTKLFAQADALVAAKLFDQAIAIYDQILAKEPGNATAQQGKARVLNLKTPKQ